MNFVKERLGKWISAAIIIVVGILCIVAGVKMGEVKDMNILDVATGEAGSAIEAISYTLGITMIVVGSLSLVAAIILTIMVRKGFALVGTPGAMLLAIGISLVVAKYAYTLISILITVVPYLLIAMGAVVLVEVTFTLVNAIQAKKVGGALVGIVVGYIIAVAAIVLGALCIGNDPVIPQNVQLIVFGIVVVLVGLFQLLSTFIKMPETVVVVTKK